MGQALQHAVAAKGGGKTALAVAGTAEVAQYLTFQLGGEMYAVGILNVKEIIEYGSLTEIPMMPAFIRGVIKLRGAVVPVIDLLARFGKGASQTTKRTCIVIILPIQQVLSVDEIAALTMVADQAAEPGATV